MLSFFRRKKKPDILTVDKQLKELYKVGIGPNKGIQPEEFLKFRKEAYLDKPYLLAMMGLGGSNRKQEPFSDQIWHLQLESIYASGDYARIARRMRALAAGELPLQHVRDRVDHEEGVAWLEFQLDGESIRWEARLQEHWIDPQILSRFAQLLHERQLGSAAQAPTDEHGVQENAGAPPLRAETELKAYTYIRLSSRDCLIGCATSAERAKQAKVTGLNLEWLV